MYPELIERLSNLYATDAKFKEDFKKIVSRKDLTFKEKLEKLEEMNEKFEQKERDARHRVEILESLAKLNAQIEDIEQDGLNFENDLTQFEDSSSKLKANKKQPLAKLMQKLLDQFHFLD